MSSITKFEVEYALEYLKKINNECGWIEVKEKQLDENILGITISAIANTCLLEDRDFGYIFVGIKDRTWEIKGVTTKFSDFHVKGSQDIVLYLRTELKPDINFQFFDGIKYEDKLINVVKIQSASHTPISYNGETYIRIGSSNKKLKDFPELNKSIWLKASGFNYEDGICKKNLEEQEILKLLDYKSYYSLLRKEVQINEKDIINDFIREKYIEEAVGKKYNVKTLGALLFANEFDYFNLERKGIRIIKYNGVTKASISTQKRGKKGYAAGFSNLIKTVNSVIPKEERISKSRNSYSYYSEKILRELVANAIIHQDLTINGNEVKIEFYDDRVEISNPGKPIIDIWRFYDANRTRNTKLAYHMNRFNICEELGSGVNRIVEISEKKKRFTPKYIVTDQYTVVKLFKEKEFENMTEEDKMNMLFYHCCHSFTIEKYMTNSTLRGRFLLDDSNASSKKITRLINKSLEKKTHKNRAK